MIKILVMGTLLLGSLALLTNMVPTGRQHLRSRRLQGASRTPMALVTAFMGLDASRNESAKTGPVAGGEGKIFKTEQEWKAALTEEQYRVTRCSGTERPFTGRFWDHKENGTYTCVGCGQDLFSSGAKYDAGTGWPSYTGPVDAKAVTEIKDISYGMVRTEIVCSRCEAHLGHVFPDGPRPGEVRYCINSASLDFVGKGSQPTH